MTDRELWVAIAAAALRAGTARETAFGIADEALRRAPKENTANWSIIDEKGFEKKS